MVMPWRASANCSAISILLCTASCWFIKVAARWPNAVTLTSREHHVSAVLVLVRRLSASISGIFSLFVTTLAYLFAADSILF